MISYRLHVKTIHSISISSLGISCLLFLGGCSTFSPSNGINSQDLALMVHKCEGDGRPVWLKPDIHINKILELGTVLDPSAVRGRLLPDGTLSTGDGVGYATAWFYRLGLTETDVNLSRHSPDVSGDPRIFGPSDNDALGIYRFKAVSATSSECDQYKKIWQRRHRGANETDPPFNSKLCFTYDFVGPYGAWQNDQNQFVSYNYRDSHSVPGIMRRVFEIRHGSAEVVARAVVYISAESNSLKPECFARSQSIDFLFSHP